MAETKKYFWLKLKDDFFDEKYIKALRRLPQGDSLVIVYLKMQLKSLKTEGIIKYEQILPDAVSELAMLLDEDENIVRLAIEALLKFGVIERWENETFCMVAMQELIGGETASAIRVRKHRTLKENMAGKDEIPKLEMPAKTNAERQRAFRAKKACEEVQHVPFIEDYANSKRYGGNYYVVMKRDKYKCAICGSVENLCVHHIDGYDENKPENNRENKMLVLCRACHSQVHAGTPIPNSILESIDYFENNVTLQGNGSVTKCNTEIDIEIEKDIDIDIEREIEKIESVERKNANGTKSGQCPTTTTTNRKRFTPPTLQEVQDYCKERGNGVSAENFIDYYTANGWRVGKNPMKDWKACVRTWERTEYNRKSGTESKKGVTFYELGKERGIFKDEF